jgi:hypothetical protein
LINRWANTYAYQDFDATAGEDYDFSVNALSSFASNHWQAVMKVAWLDSADAVIGSDTTLDELAVDAPENTWLPMAGTATAPAGAVKGRIVLTVAATGSKNYKFVFFDNASVTGPLNGITYENWANENGIVENPVDDGDSATLLVEYAFNLDPTRDDALPMTPGTGTNGLPCWALSMPAGLTVEYLRRTQPVDLTYTVQFSNDLLAGWVDAVSAESVTPIDANWERVVVDDHILIEQAGSRFGRVTVSTNPVEVVTHLADGAVLNVVQTWSQETNYTRTATVAVPPGTGPHPVLIALHGAGGTSSFANNYSYLDQMIRIGPQGYSNRWNVENEPSLAPDVDFMHGIKLAGQLNASQHHDNAFWHDPAGGNAYDTAIEPATGRRILSVVGTADTTVPYAGGSGVAGYVFLHAQDSLYTWAEQMGYTGSQIPDASGVLEDTDVYSYSYLGGDVELVKLVGGNHGLQPFAGAADGRLETIIKDFLSHP